MFQPLPARWLAALPAVVAALPAAAQTPPAEPLPYRSAFENYQRFQDDQPVPWKEANDTVRQRGGWRAYAKEGATAGQSADPHAGHRAHGDARPAADAPHGAHGAHGNHAAPTPPPAGAKEQP